MGLLQKLKKTKERKSSVPAEQRAKPLDSRKSAESVGEPKKSVAESRTPKTAAAHSMGQVLLAPLLSEKGTLQEAANQYTFYVSLEATKIAVKQAVSALYGVNPIKVNMINMDGKRKRVGRRFGRRIQYKKAVVFLPAGKSISIHEGV